MLVKVLPTLSAHLVTVKRKFKIVKILCEVEKKFVLDFISTRETIEIQMPEDPGEWRIRQELLFHFYECLKGQVLPS